MADISPITSARALKTALCALPSFSCPAVHFAFCDLLESLTQLVRIEEIFASDWSFDPAFALDPGESVHAYEVVRASVQEVRDLTPASKGDKALKLAALMVQLAIDMEEAMDRSGVHQMIAHARACLLLGEDDPDGAATNHLLRAAFTRLDRLAALEEGEVPFDGCDAELEPVFCA